MSKLTLWKRIVLITIAPRSCDPPSISTDKTILQDFVVIRKPPLQNEEIFHRYYSRHDLNSMFKCLTIRNCPTHPCQYLHEIRAQYNVVIKCLIFTFNANIDVGNT